MNNIKLFMLLIMAATSSVAIADGPEYSFTTADDGNTLVINGKGDLTDYNQTTDRTVFTQDAVNNVFVTSSGVSVTADYPYDPDHKYYEITEVISNTEYEQLFNGGTPTTENDRVRDINTSAQRWNVPNGVYLYSITGAPTTTDKWNSKVGENNTYLYPATYNNSNVTYSWNSNKTQGKTIYVASMDNSGDCYISWEQPKDAYNTGVTIYAGSMSPYVYFYVYTNTEEQKLAHGTKIEIGTDAFYVPQDFVDVSADITITADLIENGDDFSYSTNSDFTYKGTQYAGLIVSNQQIESNEIVNTLNLSENGRVLSLVEKDGLPSYHTSNTTVTINSDRITNGITPVYNSNVFWYNSQNNLYYVTSNVGELAQGATSVDNVNFLTSLPEEYRTTTTTFQCNSNNLYLSTDGGTTKTKLTDGTTYIYEDGYLFYLGTTTETNVYGEIANNSQYFETDHPGYKRTDNVTISFKQDLLAAITSGSYTKVEFKNTTAESTPLTIDPEIVQIINFPNNNQNTNLTNLDLGQATLKLTGEETFSKIFDKPGADYNYSNTLAEVTLPLVSAVGGEVTLPSNAIPVGYDNASAALRTVTVPNGYTKIGDKAFALARPGYTSGYGSAKITTINLPEGLKEIGDEAFYGITNLANINITGNKVEGRSLVFPSTLATIGESAFEACTSLTSTEADPFILPSGLRKIKASAFVELTNLKFLELNEGLQYVGNSAFGLTSAIYEQTTITFPSTIQYLGPGSFISRWYQDIYFTGTTAPVCPVGAPTYSGYANWGNVTAFSANTQMGNNGFNKIKTEGSTADDANGTGYANRENYINNGYYFTILHFPDGLSADNAKTYRDITRRYVAGTGSDGVFQYDENIATMIDPATIVPGSDGKTFGSAFKEGTTGGKSNLVYYMSKEGEGLLEESANAETLATGFIDTYLGTQQIWPSQSQWIRNFVTVANGVEWDGVTKYRPTVTEDMFKMMKEDGLFVKANSLDYSTKRVADANNSNEYGHDFSLADITWEELNNNTDMLDYLRLILYQGTRRFVLSYDGGYDIPFKIKLKGGRWWSICLPFNMTKAEVDEVFGNGNAGTHVCLMSGVDRTVSESGNTLVLKFKNDVYRHKTVRTVKKSGDNLVYTYASNFDKNSKVAPGENDIVLYARESYMIYPVREDAETNPVEYDFGTPVFETGDPLPTIVYSNSDAPYTTQHGSDPAYRFIGNFTTSTGNDGDGNAITIKIPQYSYAYGRENAQATQSKFFILSTAGATWSPFKSLVQNTAVGGGLNDWNNFFQQNTARVNQVSLFGDDEEVTGIDNVIIEVSSDNDEDLRVFNLNGSMMGNSLQGLPAGTYIQGGKAYRVK